MNQTDSDPSRETKREQEMVSQDEIKQYIDSQLRMAEWNFVVFPPQHCK